MAFVSAGSTGIEVSSTRPTGATPCEVQGEPAGPAVADLHGRVVPVVDEGRMLQLLGGRRLPVDLDPDRTVTHVPTVTTDTAVTSPVPSRGGHPVAGRGCGRRCTGG